MVKVNSIIKDPISTISIGIVVTIALTLLMGALGYNSLISSPVFMVGTVIVGLIGGFIATYFAKEKKMRYGIYEGIFVVILVVIFAYISYFPNLLFGLVGFMFLLFLPACIGGYLGKTFNHSKQNTAKTTV